MDRFGPALWAEGFRGGCRWGVGGPLEEEVQHLGRMWSFRKPNSGGVSVSMLASDSNLAGSIAGFPQRSREVHRQTHTQTHKDLPPVESFNLDPDSETGVQSGLQSSCGPTGFGMQMCWVGSYVFSNLLLFFYFSPTFLFCVLFSLLLIILISVFSSLILDLSILSLCLS